MYGKMKEHLSQTLAEIKEAGLYKEERLIESAQQAAITVKGKEVLNFCANNYLGLSNHPRLIKASQEMMERRGFGMSSVRFICGTQDIHKELEAAISDYFLFRRQRRCVRTAFQRRRRHHLGLSEPCFYHRRRTSLQSETLSLCQRGYEGSGKMLARSSGTTFPYRCYRRCILYGRKCSTYGSDL